MSQIANDAKQGTVNFVQDVLATVARALLPGPSMEGEEPAMDNTQAKVENERKDQVENERLAIERGLSLAGLKTPSAIPESTRYSAAEEQKDSKDKER